MRALNSAALSRALATRLNEVMPPRLRVDYRDGVVGVVDRTSDDWSGGQAHWRIDEDSTTRDERQDALLLYCQQMLGGIQDQVVLETKRPWPGDRPTGMPLPYAELEGDVIRLGFRFRDANEPVLELEPLPLRDFSVA